jgi:hypothetical protein
MRRVIPLGFLNVGGLKPAFGGIFVLQSTTLSAATGATFNLEAH